MQVRFPTSLQASTVMVFGAVAIVCSPKPAIFAGRLVAVAALAQRLQVVECVRTTIGERCDVIDFVCGTPTHHAYPTVAVEHHLAES